jgi:hypothetical protein
MAVVNLGHGSFRLRNGFANLAVCASGVVKREA